MRIPAGDKVAFHLECEWDHLDDLIRRDLMIGHPPCTGAQLGFEVGVWHDRGIGMNFQDVDLGRPPVQADHSPFEPGGELDCRVEVAEQVDVLDAAQGAAHHILPLPAASQAEPGTEDRGDPGVGCAMVEGSEWCGFGRFAGLEAQGGSIKDVDRVGLVLALVEPNGFEAVLERHLSDLIAGIGIARIDGLGRPEDIGLSDEPLFDLRVAPRLGELARPFAVGCEIVAAAITGVFAPVDGEPTIGYLGDLHVLFSCSIARRRMASARAADLHSGYKSASNPVRSA